MTYSVLCAVKWRGSGTFDDPYNADIDSPGLLGWEDVTGQAAGTLPPNPPIYLVRAVVADNAAITALNALTNVLVLYRRNDDDDADGTNNGDLTLSGAQVTAARSRLVALGVPSGAATTIIGTAGQFTRDQIARRLVIAARQATKATVNPL